MSSPRRLVWLTRLLLYPLVLGLLVAAWHARRSSADEGAGGPLVVRLHGTTSQGWPMHAVVAPAAPESFDVRVRLRCVDGFTFDETYSQLVHGGHDLIAGGRVVIHRRDPAWSGGGDWLDVRADARFSTRSFAGVMRASGVVTRRLGRPGVACDSGPVRFALKP